MSAAAQVKPGAAGTVAALARTAETDVPLRLRPGVGHVPIRGGIRFQHWDTTFRIQGHPALHALFTGLLPQLQAGVTAQALQAALPAGAWPAARLLLNELRARDLLLPVEEEPNAEELGSHAGILTFLASLSDRPSAAFRAVRAARVTLRGPAALTAAVAAHLRDLAFADVQVETGADEGQSIVTLSLSADSGAPTLLAALGAEQGIIAPLHTPAEVLAGRLTLSGTPAEPLKQLLAGLLALEAFRQVAELKSGVSAERGLVVDAATLHSAPVPAFLQPDTLEGWWTLARAELPLAGPDDLHALLTGPFALTTAPSAAGEQLPLFTYGAADGPAQAGWGSDGEEALHRAQERRLLALLPAAPEGLAGAEVALPVLGYSETDLLGRGVAAVLSADLARQPERFTAQPLPPAEVPLAHLWLLKTLGMVYGVAAEVVRLGHPALRGLHGAAVYDPARGLLAAAFAPDPDGAVGGALLDAVAALQLGLPVPGTPAPPAGEVRPVPSDQPEQATWAALTDLGRAPRLHPYLGLPGTVQRGVLLGWVVARG
ncbi:hypothetical protein K7W42_11115 [Deinococcus sp. HMF7604]|uniref:hypothetical protein n=1 Tax=Deinococcus betulae TaxID=2873312 RepID=UPI001CCFB3C0|nr:hypothetical protein [Deinococcus betulae]MBZ9751413.1 hypothetical protein [Deinococcus betulae]